MTRSARTIVRLTVAAACTLPALAAAQTSFSLLGGWRTSGTFEDSVAERRVRMKDSGSVAVALDFALDVSRELELFASNQRTSLAVMPIGGNESLRLPLTVTTLHFGGTNFFDGPAGSGPFVAGGLGLTRLAPGLDGFSSETKPSLSLALGYVVPLGPYFALRVEGRGTWMLINSSGGLFCSGGCTVTIKGDTLQQVEMLLGITGRF